MANRVIIEHGKDSFNARLRRIEQTKNALKPSNKRRAAPRPQRSQNTRQIAQREAPRRSTKRRPMRLIMNIAFGFLIYFGIKVLMVYNLGVDAFDQRVAELRSGDQWQPLAAYVMNRGETTQLLYQQVAPLLDTAFGGANQTAVGTSSASESSSG